MPKATRPKGKQRALPEIEEPIELYEDDPPFVAVPDDEIIESEVSVISRKSCKSHKMANYTISREMNRKVEKVACQDANKDGPATIYRQMLGLREKVWN